MAFVSELLGRPVAEVNGQRIGRLDQDHVQD
jgi:sporulation protein YlmC with PRC-barrel domain